MLKSTDETDFHELKMVSFDRLSPEAASAWFLAVFIFSGVMTGIVAIGVSYSTNIINPLWDTFVKINVSLLILHLLISLLFISHKVTYRFQRFQSVWVCYISLKMSLDTYALFFAVGEVRNAPDYIRNAGILLLLGGFMYLAISIYRGIRRVQQGEFRRGGRSLYNFQQSKGYVSLPIIYGATVFAGSLARFLSEKSTISSQLVELCLILLFAVLLQYVIAMVWPEFLLLAYCKFKFASFRISEPERVRKQSLEKRKSFKDSLLYWYNKPLMILKSRTGWKYEDKAPFWTLILVWLQLSFILLVFLYLIDLYGVLKGKITLDEVKNDLTTSTFATVALFLSFALLIIVKLILIIVRKIKK